MLYKVLLTCESVDKIIKGDHSIESYKSTLTCGVYAFQASKVILLRIKN